MLDLWLNALRNYQDGEYKLFLAMIIQSKTKRIVLIKKLYRLAKKTKMTDCEAFETIARILNVSWETVKYHTKR